ncbi:fibrinogen-like YCDxxxxGGGW domain-containing protein [Microbacterium sp. A93]|uniref:fibrinogen-like YCDxxxxGGGW domain-containing protein n=1 Tax=Microbacterium sp. A93 TaxID=3450716 RepID=UPI003F427018
MNTISIPRQSKTARIATGAAVAIAAMIGTLLMPTAAPAAEALLPDGLTEASAAASCWEIKQSHPASTDGIYWLVTPELVAPEQFYCDQTTDGGGWVLIGRGRQAWKEGYNGLRTPAQLRNTVTGTGAFLPAQLPSATVDALLNGERVDTLADGIRLRRATNTGGTQWQEVRFKLTQRDRWVWTFGATHRVASYSFNGSTGSGGQTNNFGSNNQTNRVVFSEQSSHGYVNGWAFGSNIGGSTAADSYVWSPSGQGYARPFTQMFLRPKLTLAALDFGTVPAEGTPASTVAAIPESDAITTSWGVSGFANGSSGELNTEVAVFGEAAGNVFVGGNFKFVQRTQAGGDQVQQSNLAAFDVSTGQWNSTFRPTMNGQVKAIATLPDGRLAIGGQFSMVNGVAQAGLAFLDPNTGELSGWQVAAEHRSTGGVPYIRGLDVQGGHLYVAGSFTHLTAVGSTTSASTWNGGRIDLATGAPDINWNAFLNGTSVSVDASDQGDRTYFSGYFKMKQSTSTPSAAAIQTASGAPLVSPLWVPRFSKSGTDGSGNITGNVWQLGVQEAGDKVWLGGSEHSLFAYSRDTFELLRGSITNDGGDFQTVETNGALVIAGCHCGNWVYQDAYTWRDPGTAWEQADKMNLVGAWDAATGDYIHAWSPTLQARAGYGAWGTFYDSTGVLWVGGDFSRSVRAGEVNQWSGGYIRFAPMDTAAPTTPGEISAVPASTAEMSLTWGGSSDPGGVTYEVLRENHVIASTTTATYTVPVSEEPTNYFVRARDAAGNRSASTPAFVVAPLPESALTFADAESEWTWRYSNDALPADWNIVGFDDSAWATGNGLFGRGVSSATTDIEPVDIPSNPLSAQFRRVFEATEAASIVDGTVTVIADDGVVVYLNGVELGRANLPEGTLTQNSYATSAPRYSTAVANPITFAVPAGALVNGDNVIAASTHAGWRASLDLSFQLSFTADRGEMPAAPDAVTALVGTSTADAVTLTWTAPAEGTAPTGYTISRDGEKIGTTDAETMTFTDTGLSSETEYSYDVVANGLGSLVSPAATAVVTTTPPPDANELPVAVDAESVWSWRYSNDALPSDWNTVAFDDAAWEIGTGLFARGVSGATTDIEPVDIPSNPLSAQFRHTFDVIQAASLTDGTVTVIADDGVVVYLNGTELGRSNLPEGALSQNSYAQSAPRHSTAIANPVTFAVPASLLFNGENVIAASTHAGWRATTDLSFQLSYTAERGEMASAPNAVTDLSATSAETSVTLTWAAPAEGSAPTGYVITRGGENVGSVDAATTTFSEDGLTASTAYTYAVTATGLGSLISPPATVEVSTTAPPAENELPVSVDGASVWSWRYSNDALPADWNALVFDDSAWATGTGLFGRGVAEVTTDIEPVDIPSNPLSAQFRHTFTVLDAGTVADGTVTAIANDGVVLYLNGVELGRANLPEGPLTQNTYTTVAPRHSTAAAAPVTFSVPAALLQEGENVIAASTHASWRATPDLTFELSLSMLRG